MTECPYLLWMILVWSVFWMELLAAPCPGLNMETYLDQELYSRAKSQTWLPQVVWIVFGIDGPDWEQRCACQNQMFPKTNGFIRWNYNPDLKMTEYNFCGSKEKKTALMVVGLVKVELQAMRDPHKLKPQKGDTRSFQRSCFYHSNCRQGLEHRALASKII